jgi:predicted dehydrogenase
MTMPIRVGLIGAGRSGCAWLESFAASKADVQIVAICDNDRGRAEAAAKPFGAAVHIHYRTLLESERLDALAVCLPPFARGEPESAAARAGIHLLLEPPVALSVERARQIQKEVEKSGVVASVAYPWRYLSGTDDARALLKDRRVALVRGWRLGPAPEPGWRTKRESCGGQLLLEAMHLLDLARWFGGDVASVYGMQFQGMVAARVANYDIEDAAFAGLRFRSGAMGEVIAGDVAPREETLLSVLAGDLEIRLTAEWLETIEAGRRAVVQHAEPGLAACQRAFLEAVKAGDPKLVRSSYADAVQSLAVAAAANESAQTGKVIGL